MDTDVLIVGAGPTGLMLANQLARRSIRFEIIDRHSGPAQQSRAMAVHARTLEIYAKLGIAGQAVARGARGIAASMWAGGRWRAQIPVGDIGKGLSPFPFVLMLGQDENEFIMGDKLRDLGAGVQWNTELIALEQRADGVDLTLKQPDGTQRQISAAWVAGCDGSRSAVREKNGIGFPGAPYEHTFFVADTEATGSMRPDEVNVYLSRDGFHLFFPMRGKDRWRVIGILPPELRAKADVTFEQVVPSVREQAGASLDFRSCLWFSTYRIYHRAAERFRDRRCFVLGDAAHVHSPMGGQGMNTGLQDAYNLAWKLALVVSGRADAALLDTYAQERMPVAQELLNTTDRAFQLVVADSWLATMLRTRIIFRVAALAMTFDSVRQRAFRTISQIGIRYPRSALSQTLGELPRGAPKSGDRFPWLHLAMQADGPAEDLFQVLDDTAFNLLVFGPAPAATALAGYADLVRVHAIPLCPGNKAELDRVGITAPSFYLLRPDGHVGLCGPLAELPGVESYLSRWLRPGKPA
jgi:2-polyprenyl-6-methoxyphenol hydroxylase-like FAD-dependent oxidoreductase